MVNVETEVEKFKNCKDRDELGRQIKNYKNLAVTHAGNLVEAGKYTKVVQKLQEILDKLPAPVLKPLPGSSQKGPAKKTANLSSEEKAKINEAWKQKTKK